MMPIKPTKQTTAVSVNLMSIEEPVNLLNSVETELKLLRKMISQLIIERNAALQREVVKTSKSCNSANN